MRAKHFLLLTLLVGVLSNVHSCPTAVKNVCSCQNDQEGVILQCIGHPINEIIHLLLVNQAQLGLIKQLAIQQTPPIVNLTAKFFDGLYIKKLVLQHTGIEQIDPHAFNGLANTLQDLNLAHNKIKQMPSDALNKLTSLLSIDLSNNTITDLTAKNALPTLKKLFELNLGNNNIGDVHKSFFENVKNNIQSINLGHNQLKSVPASALRGFRQLMALHLHNNKITALESLSFMNLPVVNLLNLASNKIKTISRQAFINVPNLRYLYLTDNNIEDVLPHQFGSFDQLEMIDMSNNRLSNLTAGSFANLPQLKQLYLGNNRIMEIQSSAFTNSSITVLILESNQLKEITETMFKGMSQLQQLSLKENRISNINQNAFYDTPALVMVDLSHNEIFDVSPSTFVSQPNMLLIDLSHNKILRVPYGAFGRRVVTVLLQENPLVCTEKIHMLQQGIGMLISNNEDLICGAQRSIDLTVNNNNKIIQPLVESDIQTALKSSEFNGNLSTLQSHSSQPDHILHSEDALADAFRQAELDQKRFEESGGFVPQGTEHVNEPSLNPAIPLISGIANSGSSSHSEEVIRRPTPNSSLSISDAKLNGLPELLIRPLNNDASPNFATAKQSQELSTEIKKNGDEVINEKPNTFVQLPTTTSKEEETPERIDPAPLPNLKLPTKIRPAYPINSHTLPPSIVIAAQRRFEERIDLTPGTTKNTQSSPTTNANLTGTNKLTKDEDRIEPFNINELQQTSQSSSIKNVELRGDRSLPTLLIIICLSTVGVVVVAVFVGMCFVHRRRCQQKLFGSSSSSMTARSNSYYGTNTLVYQHPNTQPYITPNQFDASQMSTLQRARRNSLTYATPTPNDDIYTWLYSPGPYTTTNPFPNK